MGEREKPRQIKMSWVIKPTIFCSTPLLHIYQTLQRIGRNWNLKMYEMRLGLGIGSLWAGYHLPWLSSTDGDWDTLRGNMGHTHTKTHKKTQKHKNTKTHTHRSDKKHTHTHTNTHTGTLVHTHTHTLYFDEITYWHQRRLLHRNVQPAAMEIRKYDLRTDRHTWVGARDTCVSKNYEQNKQIDGNKI